MVTNFEGMEQIVPPPVGSLFGGVSDSNIQYVQAKSENYQNDCFHSDGVA